MMKLWKTEKGV